MANGLIERARCLAKFALINQYQWVSVAMTRHLLLILWNVRMKLTHETSVCSPITCRFYRVFQIDALRPFQHCVGRR